MSADQLSKPLRASRLNHGDRFIAIYYAVAALGAIVASKDESTTVNFTTPTEACGSLDIACTTSLDWARFFFGEAQAELGDVIQVCSLESAQALFLLVPSCYCIAIDVVLAEQSI